MPKPVPFKASAGGLMNYMGSKITPHLAPVGAMMGLEGIEEGMQEVYQEWIKYIENVKICICCNVCWYCQRKN